MTKKSKGVVVLNSSPLHGVGVYWDARTHFKHQSLMQDYMELQKEVALIKSKLEVSKQRKLILAAEVRFLRRRYKLLMQTKTMNSSHEPSHEQLPNLLKRNKTVKKPDSSRKEASLHRLPPIPELKPKKKNYVRKAVSLHMGSPSIDRLHKPILHVGYGSTRSNFKAPILDLNPKEGIHASNDVYSKNSIGNFDLNRDSFPNWKEASLPSRAPVFDLNEILTGEEEFQISNEPIKFEEAKKSSFIRINEVHQNELKISICRNAGEGSSHVGKRKISWLDPVALRV